MTDRIRAARPADADGLLDLIQLHAHFERGSASITISALAELLTAATPPTQIVVLEADGALVGYAAYTFDFALWRGARFAHLDCLFVREAYRGKGLGQALFRHVCKLARRAEVDQLEWQTPSWNQDAIRFYTREGGLGRSKVRFSLSTGLP